MIPHYLTQRKLRLRLWAAQPHVCALCGEPLTWEQATIDHIVPKSRGGSVHKLSNMQLAHRICNQKKGNGS